LPTIRHVADNPIDPEPPAAPPITIPRGKDRCSSITREEEAADLRTMRQVFDVAGWPESYPPERWIGNGVMEIIAERYPAFAADAAGKNLMVAPSSQSNGAIK
jgi:hypothetical protein